ncbi:MAG: hypothetical protein FJZ88_10205, partial [Chloroflexi bacterium]|nr:hypothetical protein [Chloroflexota bacterium]
MVGWFHQKDREKPASLLQQETPVPAGTTPVPLAPALSREPDYSRLPSLQTGGTATSPDLASVVVIGLGPVGQAVVETMASWLPPDPTNGRRPLDLLVVRLSGEARPDFELPLSAGVSLRPNERKEVSYIRGASSYPWYPPKPGGEWKRVDGRLALFQDLGYAHSDIWSLLQAHLGDGREPDVWLVSSAFDTVGSGIIFDLAHIVRLVGEAQNYAPFIGWMLALPNYQWADAHRAEAAATLRELMRLLRHDLLRNYEYSAKSDNRKLWAHQARGDEDANIVMLCEATADFYGPKAAEAVVGHMALALLALAQPEVWQTFRNSLRHQAQMLQLESQASIGAFGV